MSALSVMVQNLENKKLAGGRDSNPRPPARQADNLLYSSP